MCCLRDFDRTAVALSLVCDVPMLKRFEQLLVLAKAAGFSWETTKALLRLKAGSADFAKDELGQCFASFARLQEKTAKAALQFFRLRDRAGAT